MVDSEDLTADLPMGDGWRFGLGAQYQWDEDLLIGFGYTFVWLGDLDIDQQKTSLVPGTTRLSGEYECSKMHFFVLNFRWM
jgi:long-chain fatty acid transport protein